MATNGKAILNYTTQISPSRTVGEIMDILARAGASAMHVTYAEGVPTGLEFAIATSYGDRAFRLPANIRGVQTRLEEAYNNRQIQPRFATPEQAQRVAWRIVRDWIEAQMALIEAGQAELTEVLLPYMLVDQKHTVYGLMIENHMALPERCEG